MTSPPDLPEDWPWVPRRRNAFDGTPLPRLDPEANPIGGTRPAPDPERYRAYWAQYAPVLRDLRWALRADWAAPAPPAPAETIEGIDTEGTPPCEVLWASAGDYVPCGLPSVVRAVFACTFCGRETPPWFVCQRCLDIAKAGNAGAGCHRVAQAIARFL